MVDFLDDFDCEDAYDLIKGICKNENSEIADAIGYYKDFTKYD